MISKISAIITHYADKNSMLSYYTPTECWENLFKLLKLHGSLYNILSECRYIEINDNFCDEYGIKIYKKEKKYDRYHYYKIKINYIKYADTRFDANAFYNILRYSTILQYLQYVYTLIVEVITNQHKLSTHEMQVCNLMYKLILQK